MPIDPGFEKWMCLFLSKKRSRNYYNTVKRLFYKLNLQHSDFDSSHNINKIFKNYLNKNINLFHLHLLDNKNKSFDINDSTIFLAATTMKDQMYAIRHYLEYINKPTQMFNTMIKSIPRRVRIQEENALLLTLFDVNKTSFILNRTISILIQEQYKLDTIICKFFKEKKTKCTEKSFKHRLRNFLEVSIRLFVYPFSLIDTYGSQKTQDMRFYDEVVHFNKYEDVENNDFLVNIVRKYLVVCLSRNTQKICVLSCVAAKKSRSNRKRVCKIVVTHLSDPLSYYMYFYLKLCGDRGQLSHAFLNNGGKWTSLTRDVTKYLQDLQVPITGLEAKKYRITMKYFWICHKLYKNGKCWLDSEKMTKLTYLANLSTATQSQTNFFHSLEQFQNMIPALNYFNRYPTLVQNIVDMPCASKYVQEQINKKVTEQINQSL